MIRPAAYAAHEEFIAPARSYPELWRLIAGLCLATFAYFSLNQVFFQALYVLLAPSGGQLLNDLASGASPAAMYILLFSFIFMSIAAGLTVRLLHHRSFVTLLGPAHLLGRDFRRVSVAVLAVTGVVLVLPPWDMGGDYVPNMALSRWMVLLVPSLFFILLQVSAEEIVFRGYVQQQLAARFRSPLVWMVLPSVLFALGHYLPDTAGEKFLVEFLGSAGETAGYNLGIGIVNPGAQGTVLEVLEGNDITGFRVSERLLDLARINPVMTVENACAGFDNQAWHGGREE